MPESRDPTARGLDAGGAGLAAAGLAAATWALTAAPDRGLGDPAVVGALVLGALLLIGFVWVEARLRHPMMPPALFRSRIFSGVNGVTFLLYFALGGAMFFLPFDLIRVHGWSATAAGAAMLPFAVVMGLFSGAAGRLADRFGARTSLCLGPMLAAAGLILLAMPAPGAGYVDGPLLGMTVLAIGMTLAVGPLTATVMGSVATGQAGVASGVNNAVARIAGLLAVALLGLVLSAAFADQVGSSQARDQLGAIMGGAEVDATARQAFHDAYRVVMAVCAATAVVAGLIGLATAPGRPPPRADRSA